MRFEQIIATVARTLVSVPVVDVQVRTITVVESFANAMRLQQRRLRMLLGMPSHRAAPDCPWHAVAGSARSAAMYGQPAILAGPASRRPDGMCPLGFKRRGYCLDALAALAGVRLPRLALA